MGAAGLARTGGASCSLLTKEAQVNETWLEAFLASESHPETAAAVMAWRETLEMEKLALREKVMALPPLAEQ